MDWANIWNQIKEFFIGNGWNILKFFAVLIFGIVFIKLLINVSKKILNKTNVEKITMQFAIGVVKFILYLILTLTLLSMIGVQVSGIITAFSALLLTIGLALEKNVANFANGLIIISTRMFSKGDYITISEIGTEGTITSINFFFTTLTTTDNKRITIPNSAIVENPVANNGANDTRRVNMTFSVAYESDVEKVKKIVIDVMKSNGKVYLDKPIFCRLKVLNASSLDFYSYCWCDKDDYWDVYYYVIENVYNEFKRNNISVPFNQIEVRNRTDEVVMPIIGNSMPKRVEKERQEKHSFDLENIDLTSIFKKRKKKKKKNKNGNNPTDAQNNNNNTQNPNNENKQQELNVKTEVKVQETLNKTEVVEVSKTVETTEKKNKQNNETNK